MIVVVAVVPDALVEKGGTVTKSVAALKRAGLGFAVGVVTHLLRKKGG